MEKKSAFIRMEIKSMKLNIKKENKMVKELIISKIKRLNLNYI